jgi:hypothetical protein
MQSQSVSASQTPLLAHRVFVVHFRSEPAVAYGQLVSRVAHAVSGKTAHFRSLDNLLACITQAPAQVRTCRI